MTDSAASFAFSAYWFRGTSVSRDGTADDTVRAPNAKLGAQVLGALEKWVGTCCGAMESRGTYRYNLLLYPVEV